MHTRIKPRRLLLACALALAVAPATASAHSVGAELRVVGSDGRTLADLTQYTSPARVRTDPNADCFGPGTGGSGKQVKVPTPTALGLVADALPNDHKLRPLSITDHFSFGLGVCGIGKHEVASGDAFWYLKRNHVGSQVAGDHLKVHQGDQILWYLAPGFPPGSELSLKVPARTTPGSSVTATVYAYADDGTRTPAAGATVSFASAPTDASGRTTLNLPNPGLYAVRATRSGDIPSKNASICVHARVATCPPAQGRTIYGSPGDDEIATTSGDDVVFAGRGDDRIKLDRGGADVVDCGPGRDVVIARRGDRDDRIERSCEKVIRK